MILIAVSPLQKRAGGVFDASLDNNADSETGKLME
jgi:hypothetical protein